MKINHWVIPPYWNCNKGILKDRHGNIIADKKRNNLEIFTYSPSYKGLINIEDLQNHILSDPKRPDVTTFHFRNQYRHWNPKWVFVPHNVRKTMKDKEYYVEIESSFSNQHDMVWLIFITKVNRLKSIYLWVILIILLWSMMDYQDVLHHLR